MKFAVYFLLFANFVMAGWLFSHQDKYRVAAEIMAVRTTEGEGLLLLSERSPLTPVSEPAPAIAVMSPPVVAAPELPDPAAITATQSTRQEPVQQPQPPAARVCHVLGPFVERDAADSLAEKLKALGVATNVRITQTEQPSGYWVYLPSMPRADAQRIVSEFKAKGVEDFFLGRQYFISLGVYNDKASAEARLRAITSLGYAPTLEPRYLRRDIYWLDADESGEKLIGAADWLSLAGDYAGIKRQTLTCE